MKLKYGSEYLFIFSFAFFNFILHLLTNGQYGFHRDELYFLDCAKHLSLGYADLPPLTPLLGRLVIEIAGESLRVVRFFPALAGALAVFYTGLMVKEMNGKRFAQGLAMISIIIAPVYLVSGTQFQTIPFDQLVWIIVCYFLLRMIKNNQPKFWLLIGLIIGIGFLNKYTMLFLVFAMVSGLLMTQKKHLILNRWFFIGILIAFVIFLPNLIWQFSNQLPVLDHMQALKTSIDEDFSILQFLLDQILIFNPCTLPIWISGLYFYFSKSGKNYRALVWIFIIPLIIFTFSGAKSYYLSPAFPLLFAGGAVYLESKLKENSRTWIKNLLVSLLIISFMVTLPAWLPVLSVEKSKQYGLMAFRYDYREMIGWQELVADVAKVYRNLPENEQQITTIFTGNYGEAGAINHFGNQYGLPQATSGISSYYLWGPDEKAEVYIVVGGYPQDYLARYFNRVDSAGIIRNIYNIPNEEYNQPFYICRDLKRPIKEIWPELRHF